MSSFAGAEGVWSARLGNLRNVVRQHVIATQLRDHLDGVVTVLDVGCGQGTQAIRLAAQGLDVTGVDPSPELLEQCRAGAVAARVDVHTLHGSIDDLGEIFVDRTFDLVCAHGLLMYLPDAKAGLARLFARVAPGGLMSFTVRNGDALAYRPGIRGDYRAALAVFHTSGYRNELGVQATAHTLSEAMGWCAELGLQVQAWYGVRVLSDGQSGDARPDDVDLPACLAAEVEAGRRDPYRALGSMHIVARRPSV